VNLAQIAAATQQTFNAFRGVPFDWRHSSCAHLLAAHLINMGRDAPAVPEFSTAAGAKRALKAMGAPSLPKLMAVLGLQPIKPSEMRVGDIAVLPGANGKTDGINGAIVICAGNKFMGWHEAGEGLQMIDNVLPHVKAAFRP
jgi:hypothetical protein